MSWRYIAQRALTGEFLDQDVPLSRDELSWTLSGSGSLRGSVAPDVGRLRATDGSPLFDEWGTILYAEADGEIRWGGIVIRSKFSGPSWGIEAAGFTAYPHGIPYGDHWTGTSVDPLDAVREIWRHVQSDPDGDLGVVVDPTTCPVRIGSTSEPYALSWWEAPDCGSEVDTLATATPFDFVEDHAWTDETRTAVSHRLRLGYPRLGTRRKDLAFEEGLNVTLPPEPERDGDAFANEGLGLGAGEGRKTVRTIVPARDGRLRRPFVYTDKGVKHHDRLTALTRRELQAHRNLLEIPEVEVKDDPAAPIGSWSLGDDVLIRADLPWVGEVAIWHRITGWSLISDTRAKLTLARSDSFTYGRHNS